MIELFRNTTSLEKKTTHLCFSSAKNNVKLKLALEKKAKIQIIRNHSLSPKPLFQQVFFGGCQVQNFATRLPMLAAVRKNGCLGGGVGGGRCYWEGDDPGTQYTRGSKRMKYKIPK